MFIVKKINKISSLSKIFGTFIFNETYYVLYLINVEQNFFLSAQDEHISKP